MFLHDGESFALAGSSLLGLTGILVAGGASVARLIDGLLKTPFSSMTSVCSRPLIMRNGSFSPSSNVFYVGLCVVFNYLYLPLVGARHEMQSRSF